MSYFDVAVTSQIIGRTPRVFDASVANPPVITTPFVKFPGLVSSACVDKGPFTFLELTLQPDPGPRFDDLGGDLTPEWGMHIVDANVALGNLVDLVGARRRKPGGPRTDAYLRLRSEKRGRGWGWRAGGGGRLGQAGRSSLRSEVLSRRMRRCVGSSNAFSSTA